MQTHITQSVAKILSWLLILPVFKEDLEESPCWVLRPQVQLQLLTLSVRQTVTRHTKTSTTLPNHSLPINQQGVEPVKSAHSWPHTSLFRNHACLLLHLS